MRKFIAALPTKSIEFMGGEIVIRKLSAGSIKRIGQVSKGLDVEKDEDSLKVLECILTEGVVLDEGEEITPELLEEFPLDELAKLSNAIMEYAGVATGAPEGNAY